MDPESAVDIIKDATLTLEKSLKIYPWPPGLADELRDLRDDAQDAIDNLRVWRARGGFMPRRFYTWEPRFYGVMQEQRNRGGIR